MATARSRLTLLCLVWGETKVSEIKYYLAVTVDDHMTYLESFESSASLVEALDVADMSVEVLLNELDRTS